MHNLDKWITRFEAGNVVALGKLIAAVENDHPAKLHIMEKVGSVPGNAYVIGVTGPPGVGKSTLADKMAFQLVRDGRNLGIICVDPTSPFSGGALLGDRIRMQNLAKLERTFIKSMASRGNLGGLAPATEDVLRLLDAFGKEIIILETVGTGQTGFDVLYMADTVVLVCFPGLGDALQMQKAGIMEIADIFVVNQADRPGAAEMVRDLKRILDENRRTQWLQPVIPTVALNNEGTGELLEALDRHREYLKESLQWEEKRKRRNMNRLNAIIHSAIQSLLSKAVDEDRELQLVFQKACDSRINLYQAAGEIIKVFGVKAAETLNHKKSLV